jgi:hypothetical protein
MGKPVTLNAASPITFPLFGGRALLEASAGSDKLRKFKLLAYTGGKAYLPTMSLPVVFDLSTLSIADGMPIPALLDHDNTKPVGHTEGVQIGPETITGYAITSAETAARDQVVMSAANGFEWQLSVGVVADRNNIQEVPEGSILQINNQMLTGPFLLARNGELREITFTATGADAGGAVARLAASFGSGAPMKFSQYLQSLGLTLASLSEAALSALRTSWQAAHPGAEDDSATPAGDPAAPPEPVAGDPAPAPPATPAPAPPAPTPAPQLTDIERQAAEAAQRVQALTSLNASLGNPEITVGGQRVSLLAHAISNRWSVERMELEGLRQRRPEAPRATSGGRGEPQGNREVMQAALSAAFASRLGVANDHACYTASASRQMRRLNASLTRPVNDSVRQQAMDYADRFAGHSMVDLFAAAARLDGVDLGALGRPSSDEWLRAAFSSTSITDMYTQAVNARVMASYVEQTSQLMELVMESDVPNFMLNERKQMELQGGTPRRLPNQGVAKDITLSATGEEVRAYMYADRFQFSEQDLIDERFDSLRSAGDVMGQRSRRLLYDLIAYVLIANPNMKNGRAFFNAIDGNLRTTSALSRTNLLAALTAFETQTENGVNVDVQPTRLIVSRANRFAAAELLSPTSLITGESVTRTSLNVLAGQIGGVLADARIDNGFPDPLSTDDVPATIAGVPTSWWIADTRQPAIELVYVAGLGRAPRMRSGTLGNGQFGFWYDCSMAAGIAPIRRKSIQRNNA